jgi:DNA end-binding protein Ku
MTAIWKGSISFGLVNIPVSLHSAVRDDHIAFRMLEKDSLSPILYERVSKKTGKTVPWAKIVKGYEYSKGKYVVISEDDFQKASIGTSKSFEIEDFVPQSQIDPRFFEKPYYVVPESGSDPVYGLLREAMVETDMVGIGRITIRQKQHLAAVKPLGNALEINLMRFADEIISEKEYEIPKKERSKPAALKMAKKLIQSLSKDFEPEHYRDEYRLNLEKLIKSKTKGKEITFEEPEERQATGLSDLMERLQESLGKRPTPQNQLVTRGSKGNAQVADRSKAKTTRKSASKTTKKARKRA